MVGRKKKSSNILFSYVIFIFTSYFHPIETGSVLKGFNNYFPTRQPV